MAALEDDEVNAAAHSGWNVVVTGTVTMVTDSAEQVNGRPGPARVLDALAPGRRRRLESGQGLGADVVRQPKRLAR